MNILLWIPWAIALALVLFLAGMAFGSLIRALLGQGTWSEIFADYVVWVFSALLGGGDG